LFFKLVVVSDSYIGIEYADKFTFTVCEDKESDDDNNDEEEKEQASSSDDDKSKKD
jgi:hypothetical protein